MLQALSKAEQLKQEGNKLYADSNLEAAVVWMLFAAYRLSDEYTQSNA